MVCVRHRPTAEPPKRVRIYGSINKQKDIDGRPITAEALRQKVDRALNLIVETTIRQTLFDLLKMRIKDMRKKTKQTYTTKINILRALGNSKT